ncbi:MAG: hypothetical protein AB7U85_00230 [Alphaproteobacteria bacterium]
MKLKFIVISLLLFLLPKTAFLEESVFIDGFEDLPLMEGMSIIDDAGISFDSLSGSIVEAYADAADLKQSAVFDFYQKTLPQLGWIFDAKEGKTERFHREGQILTIEYLGDSSANTFRFEAKPAL